MVFPLPHSYHNAYGDHDDHGGSGRSSGDDNDGDVGASQCNDGLKQGAAALDLRQVVLTAGILAHDCYYGHLE